VKSGIELSPCRSLGAIDELVAPIGRCLGTLAARDKFVDGIGIGRAKLPHVLFMTPMRIIRTAATALLSAIGI
jgi:hypothetical protein